MLIELALAEPWGLVLRSNDPARAKAALYKAGCAKKGLQVRTAPQGFAGDLVLCKGPRAKSALEQSLEELGL